MSTTLAGQPAVTPIKLDSAAVVRFLQENAVFGETRRFRQLDRYEAHFRCKQYVHQEFDWWGRRADISETVSPDATMPDGFNASGGPSPVERLTVRDKRPTAPKNLCKTIVRRFTGLLLSEKRRPRVTVEGDPDTEDFMNAVVEESNFWMQMRAARDKGGSQGSVVITTHLREGRFVWEVHNTKNVAVVWKDRRTWTPLAILKMYKYTEEVDVVDPKTLDVTGTREVPYMYRRIITDAEDIIFKPLNLEDPDPAMWQRDEGLCVKHDLGFFPGVWVQNEADSDDMDGSPDCDGAWQTLDTIDRLLSQMNKGVLSNLDPTPVIKTDPKEVAQSDRPILGSDGSLNVGVSGDAKFMEYEGAAVEVALKVLGEMVKSVLDITQCVIVDPEKLTGSAQSARAIEYLFEPMIERADDFRAQYGKAFLLLLRMAETIARRFQGAKIRLPDKDGQAQIGVFMFDLPPRKDLGPDGKSTLVPRKLGPGGYIQIQWGPYFAPTETDNKQKIDNASAANQAGFIDKLTGAKSVAPIFAVNDVEGTVARAKAENEEQADRMMMGAGGGVMEGDLAGGDRKEQRPPAAGAGGRP